MSNDLLPKETLFDSLHTPGISKKIKNNWKLI